MKKNILRLLASLLLIVAADAHAQESCAPSTLPSSLEDCCTTNETNFYGKVFAGANFLQSTKLNGNRANYHPGYIFAGSLGYYWCYGLHVEGEYAYRRNAIKKIHFFDQGSSSNGHFQTSSYMGNLLWDLPQTFWGCNLGNFRPYVGAGLGYDSQQMHSTNDTINFNQKWHHFSWQLMTGLTFPFFCDTEVALQYQFHQGGCHFYNHSLVVGLIYKFSLDNLLSY